MARGVICQKCGVEAPCKYVEFYYNVGMLVARQQRSIKGNLCKRCIHKSFWRFTMLDITLGWWGMISLVVTPIFLIGNIARYLGAISLPATPVDAAPPQLTPETVGKIAKYRKELVDRLNNKEPLVDVVESIGRSAGVTPGQVVLYVREISRARPAAAAPPPIQQTRGFPVAPVMQQDEPQAAIPLATPQAAAPVQAIVPPAAPSQPAKPDLLGDIGL